MFDILEITIYLCNKYVNSEVEDSNLYLIKSACSVSGITFITYPQSQKIGMPTIFKVLREKKNKEPKQNRLRSSILEKREN